ncbi:hypothetical protein [Sporosarcina koreensis]|uniref:hypothetical protein n=1 Tax=Sporosarcina koreensis TaxID=334735 RepID=UPI00058FA415|nr:hypothetical protein [Sporosarcina koreensis]
METVKEFAGMAAGTLFFILLTWALTSSYLEEYDLTSAKPATASVAAKVGTKSLLRPPAFFVKIRQDDGSPSEELHRISRSQMEKLSIGDPVSGYATGPTGFSTIRTIVYDSIFYMIGIFIFGFISLCCLFATILSIPAIDQAEQRSSHKRAVKKKRERRKKKKKPKRTRSGWGLALGCVAFFLLVTLPFLSNLVHSALPAGKNSAEALIINEDSYVTYRKHEDSSYRFNIVFDDEDGETILAIKDITPNTYRNYSIGDSLPIEYQTSNPYNIHVRGTTLTDIQQMLLTWEMFLYAALFAVSGFVIWAYVNSRKNGRRDSRKGDRFASR